MAVTVILPPASWALGPKRVRSCSSSVISALSFCVTCGIELQASHMCSAVLRRTPRIETRSIFPHLLKSGNFGCRVCVAAVAPVAAVAIRILAYAFTSSSLMRPPGPLPSTLWMSTPSSRASRRTWGAAGTGPRCSTPADRSRFNGMLNVLTAGDRGCSGGNACSSVLPSD